MTATEPRPADAPPRWDLTPFFPSLDSRELLGLSEEVGAEVGRLQRRFDELGVRAGEPLEVTDAVVATAEEVVESFNRLLTRMRRIGSYLYGHTTTDATDAAAAGALSRYQASVAPFATLDGRFDAWLARLDLDELTARSPVAADHAYALQRGADAATHQMTEDQEDLAAELALTGGRAWAKLHADLTARLTATVDVVKAIAEGRGPKASMLALGYAGWGPGQLDEEMHRHGWHVADANDTLLYDMPVEARWTAAFEAQGIDPRLLALDSGHA